MHISGSYYYWVVEPECYVELDDEILPPTDEDVL